MYPKTTDDRHNEQHHYIFLYFYKYSQHSQLHTSRSYVEASKVYYIW